MEKRFGRTTYWFKCLVCQRCFEQPKSLIAHRTQSECRFKYRIIFKERSERSTLPALPDVIIPTHENKILQQRSNRAAAPSLDSTDESQIPKLDTLPTNDPNSITTDSLTLNLPVHPETITSTRTEDVILNSSSTEEDQKQKQHKYTCYFCHSVFEGLQRLQTHIPNHTKEKFSHKLCAEYTETSSSLKPYKEVKAFRCQTCSKCFSRAIGLKIHISAVHEGIRPFKCKTCLKCFSQTSKLKIHISSVHEGIKSFKCKTCLKYFSRAQHLRSHISVVHEGIRAFECKSCSKCFTNVNSLKVHILTVHEGIKAFRCKICSNCFAEASTLKRHISSVHEGIKSFKCKTCLKCFTRAEHLKRHISAVHETDQPLP